MENDEKMMENDENLKLVNSERILAPKRQFFRQIACCRTMVFSIRLKWLVEQIFC